MSNIGIFCSASSNIDPIYFQAARELGKWIGENRMTLVYGGSNLGIMECFAESVKNAGGYVIGVVPSIVEENGRVSNFPDEIIHTHNLSDRKDIITEKSDAIIAYPGGIGTLDELFHVMSASTIGYHNKKVIFYNVNGFYNGLLDFLDKLDETNFTRHKTTNYCYIANTFEELKTIIENI